MWDISISESAFNAREKSFVTQINNYVNDKPGIDVTGEGELALAKVASEMLHLLAFNFKKAMSMESPPEFVAYKIPMVENAPTVMLELDKIKDIHRGVVE